MISFKSITIQGFGSFIEETTFELDRNGLSIIKGRVGSGKTTIPSALVWAIYGTSLKPKSNVETWEELRTSNYQGTKVEVKLQDNKGTNYSIIRCINFKGKIGKTKGGNGLFIKGDNEIIHTERNKVDKQKFIQKLVGYSYDLFVNSIVFGQRMKKIIEESGPVKKKIFEEAFEVTFIEEAKEMVSTNLSKTKSLISKQMFTLENLETKLKDYKDDYDDAILHEDSFKKHKKENIAKLKGRLIKTKAWKLDIESQMSQVKKYDEDALKIDKAKIKKSIEKSKDNNAKLKTLVKHIVELEEKETKLYNNTNEKVEKCPTCGGTLSLINSRKLTKQRDDTLKDLKFEIEAQRELLLSMSKVDIEKLEKKLNKVSIKISEAGVQKAVKKVQKEQLLDINKILKGITNDIKEAKKEKLVKQSDKYLLKMDAVVKEIEIIKAELNKLKDGRDIEEWLIKDPLSNSGIKAYIFNNLLSKVNEHLTSYSGILGFRVEFGIDIESSRKDFYQTITKEDILIMYEDLSGGQKQLVDTSVALAIHSVISSIRPTNILFMDEPFEGLDEETIEVVSELIDYKCKEQCLYLITHHSSFNPVNAKEIRMKLNKGGQTVVS